MHTVASHQYTGPNFGMGEKKINKKKSGSSTILKCPKTLRGRFPLLETQCYITNIERSFLFYFPPFYSRTNNICFNKKKKEKK